jgi:tetratricopeptide (TPR) repeat protein
MASTPREINEAETASPDEIHLQNWQRWLAEGLRQQDVNNFSGAALAYRQVLRLEPDQADALCNLGGCYRELGRAEEGLQFTERALEKDPLNLAALCNKGAILADCRRFDEALEIFHTLLERDPTSVLGRFQLAAPLFHLGRWDEALELELQVVESLPKNCAAQSNLGFMLMRMGRLKEAQAAFECALELDPEFPSARWNLAYLFLLDGRWEEAWQHFPYRLKIRDGMIHLRDLEAPEWEGEPFPGKRLLLWAEQGFGDTLQFLRFIPEVKALGGDVLLQVQSPLLPLLGNIPGADLLLGEHQLPPPFDLHCSLLSLLPKLRLTPARLEEVEAALPCREGFLPTNGIQHAFTGSESCVRIGLAWTGNPVHRDQAFRSVDPDAFAPLARLDGVTLFQKLAPGTSTKPLPEVLNAVDLSPYLDTFAETAWALEKMHLVITADTSVAHLAGGLGVPTFLLLPVCPDWRWLQEGESTPWYPSFRIYRQKHLGDWSEVMERVISDLQKTGD